MSFDAIVHLRGLFRIVRQENPQNRLIALAPWVQPKEEICPHHLMVRWRPHQAGVEVPRGTLASWALEGVRISLETGGAGGDLTADLEQLPLPRMFALQDASGADRPQTGIFPNSFRATMGVRGELLNDDPTSFEFETDVNDVPNGRRNTAGLMAQVVIDRGEVLTDQPGALSFARLEPSQWPDGFYEGQFDNSVTIHFGDLERLEVQTVDLVDGTTREPLEFRAEDLNLEGKAFELEILHFCPDLIIDSPMVLPAQLAGGEGSLETFDPRSRDDDFATHYQLSEDPQDLLPIPIRQGEPAGNRAFECGPVVD